MQSEEPYQGLTYFLKPMRKHLVAQSLLCADCTGAAWLSSARAVRCPVKSGNERNPYH